MKVSRTTVRLNADLLREAKKLAADTGRTLTALIEDSLRAAVARREAPVGRGKIVEWPTVKGECVLPPHISLDKTSEVLEYLDEVDGRFPYSRR